MKQKWYLQTWIIALLCALWYFFIPASIVGLVLLILQHVNNHKISQEIENDYQDYNNAIEELENELEAIVSKYDELIAELNAQNEQQELTIKSLNNEKNELEAIINKLHTELQRQSESLEGLEEIKAAHGNIHQLNFSISALQQKYAIKKAELEEDYKTSNEELSSQLKSEIRVLTSEREHLSKAISELKAELQEITNELSIMHYDFSDYDGLSSEECKNKLTVLKHEAKELIKTDLAIHVDEYTSRKEINDNKKQILRCFNAECDNVLVNLSTKNIDTARNRVAASFSTLNKIFEVDGIRLSSRMLELKLEELNLVYTYELKKEQEKERQREIKAQMLEEEKLQREIEQQKKKIEKDQQSFSSEVKRLMKYMQNTQHDAEKQLYIDKIKELEDKLKALEEEKEHVLEREARATAGYVYVISNIGSFGEDIYKIGMTRRLEPMDRIKELSSASVPFEFDVHAMIFADDAPHLENTLHDHFKDRSVNKVNFRKEFFKVSIDEIESYVKQEFNNATEFTKIPTAREYRETLRIESELM